MDTPARTARRTARGVSLALAFLLALSTIATPALAHSDPAETPHGHVLLLHASFVDGQLSYARCVDLANGRSVPGHHDSIHTGNAGEALRTQAGHLVIPTAPFGPPIAQGQPAQGCADWDAVFKPSS